MKIYNLEGELANLGALYAELQNKCCELEARLKKSEAVQTNHGQVSNSQRKSPGSCGFALAKEAPVFETPIVLSSVPAIGKILELPAELTNFLCYQDVCKSNLVFSMSEVKSKVSSFGEFILID